LCGQDHRFCSACRSESCSRFTRHGLQELASESAGMANESAEGATKPPNKELKLTKPGQNGASQLNSSVGRT
jgi:hypothetical protein